MSGFLFVLIVVFIVVIIVKNSHNNQESSFKKAEKHYKNGDNHLQKKEYDQAIEELTQAIKIYPNYSDAYFLRSCVYLQKEDRSRALADSNEIVRVNPNFHSSFSVRADIYEKMGEYDKAIDDCSEMIRLSPDKEEEVYFGEIKTIHNPKGGAYYKRGCIYQEKGDYESAIVDYKESLRISPNHKGAMSNLSEAYIKLIGKKSSGDKNRSDFDKINFNNAMSLYAAKNYSDALPIFEALAKKGYVEAQSLLGSCFECGFGVAQDFVKAREWYSKAAEQGYAIAKEMLDKFTTAGL